MPDFSLGKIYKIWSPSTDAIYIGSTTQVLDKRFYQHKHGSNKCSSKVIIAFGDAKIELIEFCPCSCKIELNRREGEIQREHNNRVNIQIAGQTLQEYRDTHKEEKKEYRIQNRDKILEQMKEYNEENKEKNQEYYKEYYETNKEKIKEYQLQNKEKIKEKRQIFYEANKEQIKEVSRLYRLKQKQLSN